MEHTPYDAEIQEMHKHPRRGDGGQRHLLKLYALQMGYRQALKDSKPGHDALVKALWAVHVKLQEVYLADSGKDTRPDVTVALLLVEAALALERGE